MKRRTIFAFCLVLFHEGFSVAHAVEVLNPTLAYGLALKRSEIISQQLEQIDAADAQVRQAWGSVLPNIQVMGSYQKQEKVKDGTVGRFSPSFNPSLRINLSQPLFRGFREFAAIRQMNAQKSASELDQLNARRILFDEVMAQYFELIFLEHSLNRLNEQKSVFEKRISEILSRVKTGQSRKSDLLATQSTQARMLSQIRQTEGILNAQREMMAFLLGKDVSEWQLMPMNWQEQSIPPIDAWLGKLENRPDIQSARFRAEAGSEAVLIAKGAHFGEADLVGNYWLRRQGIAQQINWDAALVFSFPIFQGGVVHAQVDEAVTVRKNAELELQRTRRSAATEIRSGHAMLLGEMSRFQELKNAVQLAGQSVDLQTRDYRFGLVNNISVLMALTDYYSLKNDLDRSESDLFKTLYHLNAVVGDLQ